MQQRKAAVYLGWIFNFEFGGLHYEQILLSMRGLHFEVAAARVVWTA
jgi:hypothetical protein